jgi:two-component system, NarL family, response regulator NreC
MRILIADDNHSVRLGVRRILSSQSNHEVCGKAVDGTEALRMAHMLLPDLVLLDVSMPKPGGLETARLLRRELPQIKVVIMSQHDPSYLSSRVIEVGAQGYIDKNRLDSDLVPTIGNIKETHA